MPSPLVIASDPIRVLSILNLASYMQFERLGPYKIEDRIGRGGMGEVYRAINEQTDEEVAVKILHPSLAIAEDFRDRFVAEIQSLRKLRHPNIVRIYGYGEEQGVLFYAMELVKGRSLEDELNAQRRFDWQEITQIGIQICRALKHAHDSGVIHRDLKPANLLLGEQNEVKLLDFGIARLFGNTQLTTTGGVLGTADYMSPEQADGRPVTEKCDQYALGGVLYALATGRPPFRAGTIPELLQLQRYAEPDPVERYAPHIPGQLSKVIMQLLDKSPKNRFRNILVLSRHLEAMEKGLHRSLLEDELETQDRDANDSQSVLPSGSSETRAAQEEQQSNPVTADGLTVDSPHTEQGVESTRAEASQQEQQETDESTEMPTHYTEVDEEDWKNLHQASKEPWTLRVVQVSLLLLSLILLGGFVWLLSRPPSADSLFETIQQAAAKQDPQQMLSVESEVKQFLERFPQDTRVALLEEYQEEIEILQAERRLRIVATRGSSADTATPVQRLYIDSIQQAKENPSQGLQSLQALVALYAVDRNELSESDQRVLTLAERQIKRLKKIVQRDNQQYIKTLETRLQRALELQDRNPQAAREMLQAIVRLAESKKGGKQLAEQAAAALAQLQPNATSR